PGLGAGEDLALDLLDAEPDHAHLGGVVTDQSPDREALPGRHVDDDHVGAGLQGQTDRVLVVRRGPHDREGPLGRDAGAQAFPVEPYFGDDQDANGSFREETHRITPRSRPSWPVATAKVTRSWIEYRRARESSPHQRAPSRTGGARTQERESTTSRLQK